MKKVISAFLLSFVVMLCVCGFAGKKDIDKASESKDLITARVSQTTSQFDAFSNCATEEEVTEDMALWNPISASPSSGCIASGCGGSVCLISGCTGSVCFASGCGGSVCGASGCGASGCGGSVCGGSACAGSGCTGSVCGGSVCVGSVCAGSVCVNCK
ncbi:MAG: hypothetical protein IKH28_10015 [Lachnospiraceae bacterium]|nr:hypothetical protein [Lachnospiraceae bacterium]